jgi:hypothetical protein
MDTPERTLLAASDNVQQTLDFIEGRRIGANGEDHRWKIKRTVINATLGWRS